jgi:DNA gyrase subunit A
VNGSGGIAVGMATNIPPHNLNEIIDATIAIIKKPEISIDDLMFLVPGPDFPTGGLIYGKSGIDQAYRTGRGSIVMRGKSHVEKTQKGEREQIVVTEIPYQVNKARLVQKIAECMKDKRIEGISRGARRERPRGHARRRRAQEGRLPAGDPEPALSA